MPLGFDNEDLVVNSGDSIELRCRLFDDNDEPIARECVRSVTFTIQRPDLTKDYAGGQIDESDGSGWVVYRLTEQIGHYVVVATFNYNVGVGPGFETRSIRNDFTVIDPFSPVTPQKQITTAGQAVQNGVWHKLQDCFDSDDAGPWLKDMTQNFFDKDKFSDFIDEALFDINQQNPPTTENINTFIQPDGTLTIDSPLLIQGVFLGVLRQMMRSYVEQPQPQGAQVVYEDRRDYLQRWESIYQIEMALYMRWLALWKRKFLHLGEAKGLLSSKAGRLIPAPLRSRNVGRGYF